MAGAARYPGPNPFRGGGGGKSPGARRVLVAPVRGLSVHRYGAAAVWLLRPARRITTRRSIARCTVRPCAPLCQNWLARIAWWSSSMDLAAPKTRLLVQQLGEYGLDSVLIVSTEVGENLYLAARNLHKG